MKEFIGVVTNGANTHFHEQFGKGLRHHATIRDDVTHTGGNANVIFQHTPGALLVPNEVNTSHVDAHTICRLNTRSLAVVVTRGANQLGGNHAIAHRILRSINIGQEHLEYFDALLHAGFDVIPVVRLNNAGNGIEREGSFFTGEVEGHTLSEIGACQSFGATTKFFLGHLCQGVIEIFIRSAWITWFVDLGEHLVPRSGTLTYPWCFTGVAIAVKQGRHSYILSALRYKQITAESRQIDRNKSSSDFSKRFYFFAKRERALCRGCRGRSRTRNTALFTHKSYDALRLFPGKVRLLCRLLAE